MGRFRTIGPKKATIPTSRPGISEDGVFYNKTVRESKPFSHDRPKFPGVPPIIRTAYCPGDA
jgi:hypothetical protein